ncbi:hypothetical protein, partial [Streptococcus suis]|uniref:hypothetical protein n=2 Tax=Streptococcus suis TaxID=1307 RepID=UPI000ABFA67D
ISLSQSNFQFLRQTRTYFGNLASKKILNFFIKTLANGFNLVYNEVNLGKRLRYADVTQNYLSSEGRK